LPEKSLRAIGLRLETGGAVPVEDFEIVLDQGDFLGIIGPNGAGKTTLLRLLAGDLRPTSGMVELEGKSVARSSPADLAMIRSVFGVDRDHHLQYTVRELVAMGRYPHRAAEPREKGDEAVIEAMTRTDVGHLADRECRSLSSGELARAHLARSLAQSTPVMMLDEPTESLDVRHAEQILSELRAVADSGRTVLAVFHDLNAAAFHCNRLCLMASGLVVAQGNPREVLTAEGLRAAFDHPIEVIDHPTRNCPLVITV
jgi:heme transport system ATP-binding protein